MSGAMYAGEDVGALVFDYGSNTIRAGYAGEDLPKIDMPTVSGILGDIDYDKQNRTYYFDTVNINVARPNMEIVSPLKEGMIEDWELFERQMDHIYERLIKSTCEYHPVLMTEPAWNARNKREKLTEIMFEKYDIPAFFLVKNAVLAAFANGRSTGLILDSGASITSAVPVYDGYVIQQGIVKSPLAGDFILHESRKLMDNLNIEIVPAFAVAEKEVVSEGMAPKWKKRIVEVGLTKSFQNFAIKETLKDFVYSTLQVSDVPYEDSEIETMPTHLHEFPNGYSHVFSKERFSITEGLFDPSLIKDVSDGSSMLSMSHIVSTSVGFCDIDIKASLYNSIILVGGNTIFNGFTDRLTRDLSAKIPPSMKLKVISSPMPTERRFSSWIGGSILASMGSFQQMWISKQEYEEGGKGSVEKKCP